MTPAPRFGRHLDRGNVLRVENYRENITLTNRGQQGQKRVAPDGGLIPKLPGAALLAPIGDHDRLVDNHSARTLDQEVAGSSPAPPAEKVQLRGLF